MNNSLPVVLPSDAIVKAATARQNTSWTPSPDNFETVEETFLQRDASRSLMTRGQILTDEFSIRDDFSGSSLSTGLTGTVTFINGSTIVAGVGTLFLTELNYQMYIKLTSHANSTYAAVDSIISDTELLLCCNYTGASSSGDSVKSRWIPTEMLGGSVTIASSKLTLTSGTTSGSMAMALRIADYLPFTLIFNVSISQRIANQRVHIGFMHSPVTEDSGAELYFDGTDNTVIKLITNYSVDEEEINTFTLPGGLTTDMAIDYRIEAMFDKVILYANTMFVGQNTLHLPDPYVPMNIFMCIDNLDTTASSTIVLIDVMSFSNYDQVQISSITKGDPLSVRSGEDIHTITGVITTTSTSADQVILSYTVPTGKSFWIAGYTINNGETTVRGNPVKIGRNTITTEPSGPGSVDGNIFRVSNMAASTFRDEHFGIPRRVGNSGDVIKLTVTPSGGTTTVWRASIDFILR
jgi:hypothetical protein